MLRFLYADSLTDEPRLAREMFQHRAIQFHDRLGWDVDVGPNGAEQDDYDALNPLYVIWQSENGGHGGSLRLLSTVGRTMTGEHFRHLTGGGVIASPHIWECTRFCLAPGAGSQVAAALLAGGAEVMRRASVDHFIGVFDARMSRIYRRFGIAPEVIGEAGSGHDFIAVGLWSYDCNRHRQLANRAGLHATLLEEWSASMNRRAAIIPCLAPSPAAVPAAAVH